MKHCGTCVHIRRNCDGNCESCRHGIEMKDGSITCKCFECHEEDFPVGENAQRTKGARSGEDGGRYLHYEENKEVTRLL